MFVLALSTSAQATALITVPTSTPAELPIYDEPAFDWNGFYAGVYGVAVEAGGGVQAGIGVQLGVNAQFGFYLLGAEVAVHGIEAGLADVGGTGYGQLLGRAGLIVRDDTLVYAAGGFGLDLSTTDESHLLLGAGLEIAVTETLSVEAEYLHGFPIAGSESNDQITLGANWHF
jgi:outer membrane immunogenic protein